jgi:hypothetical protein
MYAQAPCEAAFGSVARAMGVLAAARRDHAAATRHFLTAIEVELAMRARPWIAHTKRAYAAMLLTSRNRDNRRQADRLLGEAQDEYEKLEMKYWSDRCVNLRQAERTTTA